jgi:hypothetical protein
MRELNMKTCDLTFLFHLDETEEGGVAEAAAVSLGCGFMLRQSRQLPKQRMAANHTSHVTRHTSHVTRHTPPVQQVQRLLLFCNVVQFSNFGLAAAASFQKARLQQRQLLTLTSSTLILPSWS